MICLKIKQNNKEISSPESRDSHSVIWSITLVSRGKHWTAIFSWLPSVFSVDVCNSPTLLQGQQHICRSQDSSHHCTSHQLHKDPLHQTPGSYPLNRFSCPSTVAHQPRPANHGLKRCLAELKAILEVTGVKNEAICSHPTLALLPLRGGGQGAASRTGEPTVLSQWISSPSAR